MAKPNQPGVWGIDVGQCALKALRLELIDGELIDRRMGKNRPHIIALFVLHEWLAGVFGFQRVTKEDPIDVSPEDNPTSQPGPDLVVLRESALRFAKGRLILRPPEMRKLSSAARRSKSASSATARKRL